jgi:hypothetical protein
MERTLSALNSGTAVTSIEKTFRNSRLAGE